VVFHPEPLAGGVDPHVGVGAVAVHVPPRPRDAAVAHQPGHLVRRLRRQGPEVPLHVVVAQVVVRAALLRANEVLELQRVADEEDRGVVPDLAQFLHHGLVPAGRSINHDATILARFLEPVKKWNNLRHCLWRPA
jgi:hypothetical protein